MYITSVNSVYTYDVLTGKPGWSFVRPRTYKIPAPPDGVIVLSGGAAAHSISSPLAHSITATASGDSWFTGSTSTALFQTIHWARGAGVP